MRVKLSTESAGAISLTPVVVEEMPIRVLIDHLLGVAGKDEARIREILARGSFVSGASRFRWQGWQADEEALGGMLLTFPDSDPSRPFDPARCVQAILRGGLRPITLPRDAGPFWDALMEIAVAAPVYSGYSYRDRADRYRKPLAIPESERLRVAAAKLRSSTLREEIFNVVFREAELYVPR